tara:strand:+ start:1004 stop:2203 length:1200 start_codon:yes stop_codon:yes gene_type:complete
MNTTNKAASKPAYLPRTLFTDPGARAFIAPQRYIQGPGVLDSLGRYLSLTPATHAGLFMSAGGVERFAKRLNASLTSAEIKADLLVFAGECSLTEIDKQVAAIQATTIDVLVAVGGGKCVDAAKAIAYRLGVPLVVVPSLASNDAPTSAVSVLYSDDGVMAGAEFYPENPVFVLVDTAIIASAPERYLVAGMGDAMATWYEAATCLSNPAARNVLGTRPTLAATAIGETCARTLFEQGVAAAAAVRDGAVTQALEDIVEANTLLSGIGFESGGLAGAHAVAQAFTQFQHVEENFLHGEMVAMGTLTHLLLDQRLDEARRVAAFFVAVGLPVHLGQLAVDAADADVLEALAKVALGSGLLANIPRPVDAVAVMAALRSAHEIGHELTAASGSSAYDRLHS